MIFLKLMNGEISYIHYMPFDNENGLGMSVDELEREGVLVESVPEPVNQPGKIAVLKYNAENQTLYYEYIDIPKSDEELQKEKIKALETDLLTTQIALADQYEKNITLKNEVTNNQLAIAELFEMLTN